LLPALVADDELVAANALNSLNNNLARLIGPALGGLLVATTGLGGVVVLDAASFLAAAGLVALIRMRPEPRAVEAEAHGLGREWLDGLRLIRRTRAAAVLLAVAALTGLGEGVIITLLVPFVTDVLKGDDIAYGVLLSAQAVGGLVGGVLIARFAATAAPARLLGLGAAGIGLIDVTIFTYPFFIAGIGLALVLIVVVGVPVAGWGAGIGTLLQTAVEDRYLGRLVGAFETTFALTLLLGTILAGALGDVLGVLPMLYVQSAVYTLAGVVVLVTLARGTRVRGS
jgi:predicted MFS family arabinose efflux permease